MGNGKIKLARSTEEFRNYVTFLMENRFDELLGFYHQKAIELGIEPLKKNSREYSPERYSMMARHMTMLLTAFKESRLIEHMNGVVSLFIKNQIPEVEFSEEGTLMLIKVVDCNIFAMIKLLPDFTQDPYLQNQIILEIHEKFSLFKQEIFRAYLDGSRGN